jgi:Flp pilus assembly protein TadG
MGWSWIKKLTSSDHRKAPRMEAPLLVAYYWDGSVPMSHEIRNISATGFYLLTRERWHPGTVVTMTLQRTAGTEESSDPERYISVLSKVVRLGQDGVGFSFVPLEAKGPDSTNVPRNKPVDKKALGRFLEQLGLDRGCVVIGLSRGDRQKETLGQDASSAMSGGSVMKRLNDESGQALIITALCMTCFFGFIALAADVGIMFHERRLLQIAADSAAIAGASQVLDSGGSSSVSAAVAAAAQAAATQNGFTTGTGTTVTVNNPPLFGSHTGLTNTHYVEVIISQSQPTLFMGFFGISSMTPTARAVAFNGASTSANCVVVTSTNASPAMDLQGSFTVTAPNCGVVVDSSASGALHFTGGGGTLTAGSVGVVGGDSGQTGDSTPAPVTGIVPVSDPLGYLGPSFPTPTGCTAGGTLTGSVVPGCYSGAVTLNNAVLTGMYIFTGNLTLSHSVTTGATGATIDLTSGTLSETPNTVLNIVAPTDPANTFHGIAIMAPATNTSQLELDFGNAIGTIKGIIYAPGAYLYLHDSGGGPCPSALSLISDLIVGTMKDQTGSLCLTSYSQTTPGSPLTKVTLVE